MCLELLQASLLQHSDAQVRSYVGCCLVERLRIYARDMPLASNEQLYEAFQLLLEQVRLLGSASDGSEVSENQGSSLEVRSRFILESLAKVKACGLLVGLCYVHPGSDEPPILVQLFQTLFQTLRPDHSVQIEALVLTVISCCIEDSETIEQLRLDAILSPFVQVNPSLDPNQVNESRRSTRRARPVSNGSETHSTQHEDPSANALSLFSAVLEEPRSATVANDSELKEHV